MLNLDAAASSVNMVVWGTVCAALCIALVYRFLKTFVFSV